MLSFAASRISLPFIKKYEWDILLTLVAHRLMMKFGYALLNVIIILPVKQGGA